MVCKVSGGNRYVEADIDTESDEMEEYEEDAHEVGYASEPTAGIMDQVKLVAILFSPFKLDLNKNNDTAYLQSPEDKRLRRRAGVSLSLSDTEAESELEYHTKIF